MSGIGLVCSICNSEPSTKGCVYDGAIVKFIGRQCLDKLSSDPYSDHRIIELDLASRMEADHSLINLYNYEMKDVWKYLQLAKSESIKLKDIKKQVQTHQQKLIAKIEEIFNRLYTILDQSEQETYQKILILNRYKRTLCDEGRELIEQYRAHDLQSFKMKNLERIEIPINEISNKIADSIYVYYYGHLPTTLLEKRRKTESQDDELSYSDERIEELGELLGERDTSKTNHIEIIDQLTQQLHLKDDEIGDHIWNISKKAREIEDLKTELSDKDKHLMESEKIVAYTKEFLNRVDRLKIRIKFLQEEEKTARSEIRRLKEYIEVSGSEDNYQSAFKFYEININNFISEFIQELARIDNILRELRSCKKYSFNSLLSGKRYIYIPKCYSKSLLRFDVESKKADVIEIPTFPAVFLNTSTCELPNGDVFLAGFSDPIGDEVYLYKVDSNECIPLPSLRNPRYLISLYYYRSYVYAFGGMNSNHAERYSLSNNSWETLNNMKYERSCLSCVAVDEKIYLFYGGCDNIEVFNTRSLEFEEYKIDNSDIYASNYGVAFRMYDRVYLVTDNLTQVYNASLIKVSQYTNTYKLRHFSIHNMIRYQECIYYFNSNTSTFEKINTSFDTLEPQPYSKCPNRYIYKLKADTKFLHRIDLNYSTVESINLSNNLNRDFNCSSLCVLACGDVIISGFKNPVSGECYLYSPRNNAVSRLPDLNIPRYFTTLICNNSEVFAFGGKDHSTQSMRGVEKINILLQDSWIELKDMKHPRRSPACVVVDNKIFIMGGDIFLLEIYEIDTNSYHLSELYCKDYNVISVMIEDKIYIIGKTGYIIFCEDLRFLLDLEEKNKGYHPTYTMGNVALYDNNICFFNNGTNLFERVNPATFERETQIITHRITHF